MKVINHPEFPTLVGFTRSGSSLDGLVKELKLPCVDKVEHTACYNQGRSANGDRLNVANICLTTAPVR